MNFSGFCNFSDAGHEGWLRQDVERVLGVDQPSEVLHKGVVQIIASEPCVAMGCEDLKHTFIKFKNREVKGSTAKIVNGNLGFFTEAMETIGEGGCCGFVQDAFDRKPC